MTLVIVDAVALASVSVDKAGESRRCGFHACPENKPEGVSLEAPTGGGAEITTLGDRL